MAGPARTSRTVGASWSWAAQVGGHALRIAYSGMFDRHPDETMILVHMGEFLPFQRSRLDDRHQTIQATPSLKRLPSDYLGTNVVFTTGGCSHR
jgi:2,3-dihydroxybenzoate decarboxylase